MLVALNRADYEALLKLAPPDRVYLQESGRIYPRATPGPAAVVSIKRSTAFRIYSLPCGAECKGVMRWRIFY